MPLGEKCFANELLALEIIDKEYPISEIFTSPQGEGLHTGQMQTFIRLAGCSVGKPFPKENYIERYSTDSQEHALLPIYTEQCTLYDEKRKFACDTDYRVKNRLKISNLLSLIPIGITNVCITGGEPLIHDIVPLVRALQHQNYKVHLETSGTKPIPVWMWPHSPIWLTISPKFGALKESVDIADELKILVDSSFDPAFILCGETLLYRATHQRVYLQPVNYENSINRDNLKLCLQWQDQFKQFLVSLQSHKVFSELTGELVR